MKNKKLEKLLVKGVVGGVFAALIGIVYRQGEHAAEALDESYEKKHDVPKKLWS